MDFKSFRYFITVAEELHVGRAAEKLCIAQPALSQRIQQLEANLGVLLFTREKRRLALTPAGELFLEEARLALTQADYAVQVARRAETAETRQVKLGYVESALFGDITRYMLSNFKAHHPSVGVELRGRNVIDQFTEVLEGNLDAGIVRGPLPAISDKLRCDLIEWEDLLVCLPENHPLASQVAISLQDLQSEMFVMPTDPPGIGLSGQIGLLAKELGFTPRGYHYGGQTTTLLCLVASGFGVALLPASMSRVGINGVVFRALRQPTSTNLYLLSRADERRPVVSAFLRECGAFLAQNDRHIERFSKAG